MSSAKTLPMDTEARNDNAMPLAITVTDAEVVAELRRHEGADRERFALAALRIGVMSLRLAGGQVDAGAVKEAGQELMAEVRELLTGRATQLTQELAGELQRYLDPKNGALPQRLEALLKKDGELERVLKQHLGGDDSLLAKTLVQHLGEGSAILRMLSPTDANGIRMQLTASVQQALAEQKEQVVREFSLDRPESALSRLALEVRASQTELGADVKGQLAMVVKEFSFDTKDSALSRLAERVELAQKYIADQFSMDSEGSALRRMTHLLESTSAQIGKSLTLDDDASALSRLKRELMATLEMAQQRDQRFQTEVRATLEAMQARKQEEERSTRHGATFEQALVWVVSVEAQRLRDVAEACGNTTGIIKNCKKGDCVVALGEESVAPGARIVFEAKEDQSYNLKKAMEEIDEARRNREAQVGVFVFSKKCAPEGQDPLLRYGNDVIVVWDADDPMAAMVVKLAYSLARALVVRMQKHSDDSAEALREIEVATRTIEKQVAYLETVETQTKTIQSSSEKILDRALKMRAALEKEVSRLDEQLASLKVARAAE